MFKQKNKVEPEMQPNHAMIKTTLNAIHYHVGLYERQNEREETRVKDYSEDFFEYQIFEHHNSLVASLHHQLKTRVLILENSHDLLIKVIDMLSQIARPELSNYSPDEVDLNQDFDRYIRRVLVHKRWGSLETELFALAKNFNVCIQVHTKWPTAMRAIYGDPDNTRTFHIAYNGFNKYDSLIPRDEYTAAREEMNIITRNMPKNIYPLKSLLTDLSPLLEMLAIHHMPMDEQIEVRRNLCEILDIQLKELNVGQVIEEDKIVEDHPSMSLLNPKSTARKLSIKWDDIAYDDPPSPKDRKKCDLS